MTDTGTAPPRRRRPVALAVAAVLVVGAAVTLGAVLGPRLTSPTQAVADAAPPPASLVTANVERRVLAETIVLRGTVEPGPAVRLAVPDALVGPTAVVTAVPVRPGIRLHEGAVVVEVAGAPLFGLALPFPLYRDLVDGMTGPDVREVQRALTRLGFDAPVTGRFDPDTQSALRQLYDALGYAVPVTDGGAPPGDNPTPAATSTAPTVPTPMLPRAHVVRLDRAARLISAVPVRVGAVLTDPAGVLVELDAGAATIAAVASHEQAALLTEGTPASVVDDVRGLTSAAVVTSVGAEPTQGNDGAGFPVRLTFTGAELTPTPNHTVRVTVGAALDAEPVLAVPVTAVYSRPDGTTFITLVDRRERTTDHTVRTGRTAGGWVEVLPQHGSVEAGTRVVVGSDFRPAATTTPPGG